MTKRNIVIASPFLIIATNFGVAFLFGALIGKWAFMPMVLIGWALWLFFILKYGGPDSIKKWLQKTKGGFGWGVLALTVGLIPLPLFLLHNGTLSSWEIVIPWLLLAIINPWFEEFYWRGLLLDYTKNWPSWTSILFTSVLFAANHAAFGINSVVNNGFELVISTLIMGLVWAIIYKKTKSVRWLVFSHFLVDFLSLSTPAFLDLFEKGSW
ncbi:CPBP family intramembrane glutamic endopeptidase [Maribacter sp. 2-571]|uniref:CPBP family intramembrane glutamic endopeptidase n=1 Tax=Maribacter sp. 2-571 TaxID=3417569 RepID=UPI003D341C40